MSNESKIEYPYLPEGRKIFFVGMDSQWMGAAKKMADERTGCSWWPTGAVVVKNGQIIGQGSNSGKFQPVCPRVEHHCQTGEGYQFCQDLCEQDGHSEVTSTNDALAKGHDLKEADLYLFGHWWCCENCWNQMIKCGIRNVYLLKNAHRIFTREKRMKIMKEIEKKQKNGQPVSKKDAMWTLEISQY